MPEIFRSPFVPRSTISAAVWPSEPGAPFGQSKIALGSAAGRIDAESRKQAITAWGVTVVMCIKGFRVVDQFGASYESRLPCQVRVTEAARLDLPQPGPLTK